MIIITLITLLRTPSEGPNEGGEKIGRNNSGVSWGVARSPPIVQKIDLEFGSFKNNVYICKHIKDKSL